MMENIRVDEVNTIVFAWLTNEILEQGLIGIDQILLPDNISDIDRLAADWLATVGAAAPANQAAFDNLLASDRGREIQQIISCFMAGLVAFDGLLQQHGHTAWDYIIAFKKSYERFKDKELAKNEKA